MKIIAKDTTHSRFSGDSITAPVGTHRGVCYAIWDIGMQTGVYGIKHQIILSFELDEVIPEGKFKDQRYILSDFYTLSLSPKSKLGKTLTVWLGREFTDEEKINGYDLEQLKGKNCMLTVGSITTKQGKKRPKITAISPALKGGTEMQVTMDDTPPDWVFNLMLKGYPELENDLRKEREEKVEDDPNQMEFPPNE